MRFSYGPEVTVRIIHNRLWITAVTCAAIAITFLCSLYLSKPRLDEKTVSAAADEVYEAVVRDMVTAAHGQSISQLVFDDTVLTDFTTGVNIKSCKESARKRLRLESNTPQFNSLADKIYRGLTRRRDHGSLRADTIEDFIGKSCTQGHLYTTFHTDLPRTFVDRDSLEFDTIPNQKNGLKDFGQTFPGAGGIISLSRVGFDSTLDEAIVSSVSVCGMLCGEARRHILRKTRGKWVVVQSLLEGIS
jgi:hypothetical protein